MILTIDLGTSGPKVSVFDKQGQLIDAAFFEVPLIFTEDGGIEQNPADWISAIERAYAVIRGRGLFKPEQIQAISVTSQWSGTVSADENGHPLMNAIIWMDARGVKQAQKLVGGAIRVEGYYAVGKLLKWLRITGGAPSKGGKDSIAHILFIKEERPEIYRRTAKFLEPKDWLNCWLSGQMVSSYDAITLYWITDNRDINNVKYDAELLAWTGIDRKKLPDLVPTNSILGTVKDELKQRWGLSDNVLLISGSPDTHSAAVGSGAVRDYDTHLYIGTSSWMICHLPVKKTDIFHNMGSIPGGIPGKYILVNEQETTGACLNFARNNIFYAEDALREQGAPKDFYHKIDDIAATVHAGSDGLMFLPWLNGERSPFDEHLARGGFYNMSLKHTRSHMLRAILEGVAMNNRWLRVYFEKLIGKKLEAINFIGGGANSDTWSQIQADVMDRPIHQMKDPVAANSRGAALLALLALKEVEVSQIPSLVPVKKTYHPDKKNAQLYRERFKIYVEVFEKNKEIWKKLNG